MFKNMKLAMKIGLGFAALIIIACALGGLAVFSMSGVKTIANVLAMQNVPCVEVANDVERTSLLTMYEARGYAYTEELPFLEKARKNLEDVKTHLKKAKEHAAKYNMDVLRKNADKAESNALEYERLLNETVAKTEAMGKAKEESFVTSKKYMDCCYAYIGAKEKQTGEAVKQADKAAALSVVLKNNKEMAIVNDIVDFGNSIIIGTWTSIATRDPRKFLETEKIFESVDAKLKELKGLTADAQDIKLIDDCDKAGKAYLGCMQSFLVNWQAREDIAKKRLVAAQAVLDAAKDTSLAGMDDTTKSTEKAAGSLASASMTMIVGLSIGV